jgi:WD40 repeat protein
VGSSEEVEGRRACLWSVVFALDGKGLWSGGEDNTLKCWDISSLTSNQLRSRSAEDNGNIYEAKVILPGHTVQYDFTSFVSGLIFLPIELY